MILKLFLFFSKFQPRDSYKINSYKKKCVLGIDFGWKTIYCFEKRSTGARVVTGKTPPTKRRLAAAQNTFSFQNLHPTLKGSKKKAVFVF